MIYFRMERVPLGRRRDWGVKKFIGLFGQWYKLVFLYFVVI